MQIHVARAGQTLGVFSAAEVRSRLRTGSFQPTDLGWTEGRTEWAALSTFPELAPPPAPAGPPPLPAQTVSGGTAGPPPLRPASARTSARTSTHPATREYYPTGARAGRETSGLAIASLVCGILGAALPAVICGHIALSRIKRNPRRLEGSGLAIAGLILGYLVIGAFILVCVIFAGPVFESVQLKAKQTQSLAQGKSIAVACRLYAAEHDGAFPKKLEDLVPTYMPDAKSLTCPLSPSVPVGYEYYGGKDSDPPTNILLVSKAATSRFNNRIVIYVDSSGMVAKDMPNLPLHKTELLR